MTNRFKILLLGGSGKLGQKIIQSGFFPNLYSPTRDLCDLNKKESIDIIIKIYLDL